MWVYELLTYFIIQLGRIREKYLKRFFWKTGFFVRRERELTLNPKVMYEFGCCDCGLVHSIEADGTKCYPVRPREYRYKLR